MTGGIFVDTNVFVYARDTAQGEKHARAVEWLERIWRDQTGRTSMQVLSELYVTLTRKLRPGLTADAEWDDIEALLAWNPFPTDRDLITRARRVEARYRTNWWDGLIVAAAGPSMPWASLAARDAVRELLPAASPGVRQRTLNTPESSASMSRARVAV